MMSLFIRLSIQCLTHTGQVESGSSHSNGAFSRFLFGYGDYGEQCIAAQAPAENDHMLSKRGYSYTPIDEPALLTVLVK